MAPARYADGRSTPVSGPNTRYISNRIASRLPSFLSAEDRFQIARRIVIAEQQYVTYNEFLPAMGVRLPAYRGYNPNLSNEFATVGYRAHSQIHGEFELETELDRYSSADLENCGHRALR